MNAEKKRRFSAGTLILTGIIIILAGGLIGALLYIRSQPAPARGVAPLVDIQEGEPDSSKWGLNFPNEYSTFLLTEQNNARTSYGGAEPYSKLESDPLLLTIFAGNAFSREYNEERGHMWSLEDVRATDRVDDKTPGTCYSCKSSNNPQLWDEMGMEAYDATPFSELGAHISNPIGCANCHEANTMRLIVTNPALEAALQAQDQDWRSFTRQQMRTVVCANCHVEYYFEGDGKLLVFPWANGTHIDEIYDYYQEEQFKDFTHRISGALMLKMQHPEYEMFTAESTHFLAGVSCADCHMPYMRDGSAKFSDHNIRSPLLNAEAACGACHTDVSFATTRVNMIQTQVYATLMNTEEALVAAIEAIGASAEAGATEADLAEARQLHREAQAYWDFVAAENSMGFHNPEYVLTILAHATDVARQAQLAAALATP